MSIDSLLPQAARRLAALFLLAVAGGAGAQGLYKIVGPDGRVTYSDRPPSESQAPNARWTAVQPGSPASVDNSGPRLPSALRQVSQRFPVTLYTSSSCGPCDAARQLLQSRGVPYVERTLVTAADEQVLQQRTGSRTLPTLTVGGQTLTGLDSDQWTSYLDAAGYPRTSALPFGWRPPAAVPLTVAAPTETAAPPGSPVDAPLQPTRSGPGGIRF